MDQDDPIPPLPTSITIDVPKRLAAALIGHATAYRRTVEQVALDVLTDWAEKALREAEMTRRFLRGTPDQLK